MAFPFAEPADPARYFAMGQQIAMRQKEVQATNDRNKVLDTFNQSMERLKVGQAIEQQQFDRMDRLADNARADQQQKLGLLHALPKARGGLDAQGNVIAIDPYADLRGSIINDFRKAPFNPQGFSERLPEGLRPFAQDFIDAGAETGVSPTTLASIAAFETGDGTSNAFRNKNNAMGISNDSGPVALPSIRDSIFQQARTLARQNGPYAGANTLDQVGAIYAPVGASNDPNGTNNQWSAGVQSKMQRIAPPSGGAEEPAVEVQAIPAETFNPLTEGIRSLVSRMSAEARDIYSAQDRAREAQTKLDTALAKSNKIDETFQRQAQQFDSLGLEPPEAWRSGYASRKVEASRMLGQAEGKLSDAQKELDSANKVNDKLVATDANQNFRVRRADRLIGDALTTSGLPADHPVITGFRQQFAVTDPAQQDALLTDTTKLIQDTARVEQDLNGPNTAWLRADPLFDGQIQIRGNPKDASSDLDAAIRAKAKLDSVQAAVDARIAANRAPDRKMEAELVDARTSYNAARDQLRRNVSVIPKPAPPVAPSTTAPPAVAPTGRTAADILKQIRGQ